MKAFQKCDEILLQGINSITDILTVAGEINIDFNDIEEMLRGPRNCADGELEKPVEKTVPKSLLKRL